MVTCRVLKLARQPYYRWLAAPVTGRELQEAYLADALFDAHRDDPEYGGRRTTRRSPVPATTPSAPSSPDGGPSWTTDPTGTASDGRDRSVPTVDDDATGGGATPGARQALLARVVDHLSEHGSHDLTLRSVAAAVGTSHRMLIYHFGSLDGVMAAVVTEVEHRQRQALGDLAGDPDLGLAELARAFWRRLRAPDLRPLERLFFEVYGRALLTQGEATSASLVLPWLADVEDLLVARGLDRESARVHTRLGLAVTRGLLLDLLATGDDRGVDAAFDLYLQQLEALATTAGARTRGPQEARPTGAR